MADVAKIQNVEHQRDETQRQQFALALQKEAAQKEDQVQTSHRSESTEVRKKTERRVENRERRRRHRNRKSDDNKSETPDEQSHIDLKID